MRKELEAPWLYEKPWYKPGKWDVSHVNFNKTVRERMPNLPDKVLPTDTTLREGFHVPGVHLDTEGYLEVAVRLAEAGIRETDCGYAANPEPLKAVKRISESGVKISTRLLVRFMDDLEMIDTAVKAGVDVIKFQTGTGRLWKMKIRDPEYYKFWESKQVIPRTIKKIKYLKENYPDVYIQLGFTGTSQHDIESLKEISKAGVDVGAQRVSCSDSQGVFSPPAIQYFAEEMRSVVGTADLQCHCHNDFGMATANTLAWVQGGGTSFDCTINGLGPRCGNAPLEECVVALELLYGVDTGVNLEKLYDLCTWAEEKTGKKMAMTKAVTGPGAFFEQGHMLSKLVATHLGVTDDWYVPYSPSVVGRTYDAVWGSSSIFPNVIRQKLENMGLSCTDEDVEKIRLKGWEIINNKLAQDGSGEAYITDPDMEKIIMNILKK